MKKIIKPALAMAAVILMAPAAYADTVPGWYIDGGLGAVLTPNENAHGPGGDTKFSSDTGWGIEGGGGYALESGIRFEGEVYHSEANINKVYGPGGSNGSIDNTDLFANMLYDLNLGWAVTPYVGGGLGLGIADANNVGVLNGGGAANDTGVKFAYQGIAGLAAQLDRNWAVTADYRYVGTMDQEYKLTTGGSARTNNASHNIIVGVRYSFGQPVEVAPQPAPPRPMAKMAAKPVVAPVPQSYMVFFDFNKSDLTPEAKRILASAAQEYKKGGFVRIVVTGHTDTVGTVAYNDKLSERRADAVKAELTRLGVDPAAVVAQGVGKNGLLVPTADQVREAQNRRAEIVFDKK